jgi:dihydrofolate reductase
MLISAIAAVDLGYLLGRDNAMPWHLPGDLRHFRRVTLGKPVIMGRRTWESIGARPLKERPNLVITRSPEARAGQGCEAFTSLDAALAWCAAEAAAEAVIIGGAALYREALPRVDCLYLTVIHHRFDGDTHLDPLNPDGWHITEVIHQPSNERDAWDYSLCTLTRCPDTPAFLDHGDPSWIIGA